jgi:radical SAM protein with 4Fe4S-binding SPASM domain
MQIVSKLKSLNKKIAPSNLLFGPEWIVLGVNNVCNLHCKMCDVGNENLESNFAQNLVGTHPINMPLELITKVIDQTADKYPKAKLAYAFTEPLVYPHLIESLNYANSKGVFTTVTTNALTLKQKAVQLSESGVNELFVSLDGPQDIHNEIRGHGKSFQKAKEGIKLLAEQKHVPKISVICAITEWNIGQLKSLINELEGLPISEIGFMHTQFTTRKSAEIHNKTKWGISYPAVDSNMDEIDFSNMDLPKLLKEINSINANKYAFKTYFSPEINDIETLETYYLEPEKIIGGYCNAIFTNMMVKSDGSVIPAHGRCYNLDIGNVYTESLDEIWDSKVVSKFRADIMESGGLFPACSRCCSGF